MNCGKGAAVMILTKPSVTGVDKFRLGLHDVKMHVYASCDVQLDCIMVVYSVQEYVMHYGGAFSLICLEMLSLISLTFFYVNFMGLPINLHT
jgi:hypothetical protein